MVLSGAGYEVDVRLNWQNAERDEAQYDLVILSVSAAHAEALAYSERLHTWYLSFPILLLTDHGLYPAQNPKRDHLVPATPAELLHEVSRLLTGSDHIRELPSTQI